MSVGAAVLAPGKCTVTQALRVMRLADKPGSGRHEVLNRARLAAEMWKVELSGTDRELDSASGNCGAPPRRGGVTIRRELRDMVAMHF